jgi:5-methyltetrahydropteroyltriglutamate--homocysteine methyltransferase
MKRSIERILTTHAGSLARPPDLLEMMRAKGTDQPYDQTALAVRVRSAVAEVVRQQLDAGVDVVSDGEAGKPGFANYVKDRLTGIVTREGMPSTTFGRRSRASGRRKLSSLPSRLAPWPRTW